MDDSDSGKRCQCVGDRFSDIDHLVLGEPSANGQRGGEIDPLQVLHDQIGSRLHAAPKDAHNVL